ncbi:outer membrane beta-barrel protein [Roseateles sp. BYS78W]|uniref:Outer membrane beta-barrel protein n=1 Tax=Pelomonas candidula TaxID=3299025 RepID=A0ABW7HGK9_9BURK
MKKHAIVLAALVVGAHAHAQDSNPFYVTGAIGAGHLDVNCNTSCDNKGKGGKILLGQNFGYGISAELGAVELGKFGGTNVVSPSSTTKITTSETYKPIAILLGAAYTQALGNNWGVKARLGVAQVKTKTDSTTTTVVTGTTTTTTTLASKTTNSKTRGYLGLGLTYRVMKDLDIELGVDNISAAVGGQGSARQVTLGATYAFGAKWGQEDELPAQGEGFYATAAVGASRAKTDCAASCDTSDTGMKLLGGYQFNHGLGLEVGYISFGKFSAFANNTTYTVKPTALLLNGALALPLNGDFGAKLRLGYAQVRSQDTAATVAKTESKPKVYYGLAATYAINKNFKVEVAADSTEADVVDQKPTVRLYSAGVTYAF